MRVFVYGTLMHEQPNHRVLEELGARRVGPTSTASPRTLVDLGPYPALLPPDAERDARACRVAGELYEIDDAEVAALDALDAFEGCPELYTRERITLEDGDAWTYVLARAAPAHARVIEDGRYAGGGRVLRVGAREATDALDNATANEEGSRRPRAKPR